MSLTNLKLIFFELECTESSNATLIWYGLKEYLRDVNGKPKILY